VTVPTVKFCGLTRADDAAEAARLGAPYLGAIFAGGPRLVTAERAASIFGAGRAAAALIGRPLPQAVGVFGEQSPDEIARIVDEASLDVVQLHADPEPRDVAALRCVLPSRVWAVLRVPGTGLPAHAADLFRVSDAVVLDAKVAGALGGTGVALDWHALADEIERLRGTTPLVLAGGLTPSNVRAAAEALGPDVVDVSSGVEQAPGLKDHQLMRAFAREAAAAVVPRRVSVEPTP
jgi:phosphoribosylanthranilate isomerase